MANIATTTFKVMGSREAVENLHIAFLALQEVGRNIHLDDLAKYYKIDYKARGISVRGSICWFKYEQDPMVGYYLLSFETESAWSAPSEIFEAISKMLGGELEINYRVIECGCEVFFAHQESAIDFFPEECCVSASGEPFGDICEDIFDTIDDAIDLWCSKTGIQKGERSKDEMVKYINSYECDTPDTYFYINEIAHD